MRKDNISGDVVFIQYLVRLFRRRKRLIIVLMVLSFLILLIITGIFTVPTNEMGALFLFGKLQRDDIAPGIHFKLPDPIQRIKVMNTAEIRSLKITKDTRNSISMVTGDENIINIQIALQYIITDYGKYITRGENWEEAMNESAMSCLTKLIAAMTVDEVLTTGKSLIQNSLQNITQDLMDHYASGITVFSATIETIQPPNESRDSFTMVANARNERAEKISVAQSNRNRLLSNARGEAESIVRRAEAESEEIIKRAKGESERFGEVLNEYRRVKKITERDYYLNTMSTIIEKANILLLQPGQINDFDLHLYLSDESLGVTPESPPAVSQGYSGKPAMSQQSEPTEKAPILITDEDELRSLYRATLGRVISGE